MKDAVITFEWKKTEKGYWVKVFINNNGNSGFLSFSHKEFEELMSSRISIQFKQVS